MRPVCLSVCLPVSISEHISGTTGPMFIKFVVQIPCGRGSVLLWRRCNMLCTSGFMDDVTFGRSGPYGDEWLAALRYRGRSLMSINALFGNAIAMGGLKKWRHQEFPFTGAIAQGVWESEVSARCPGRSPGRESGRTKYPETVYGHCYTHFDC